jgi:hypothetical protein
MTEPREQLLISKVLDNDAAELEWRELDAVGQANPLIWRELALAMKDHQDLSRAVNSSVAVADFVALPMHLTGRAQDHYRLRLVRSWGGWLAAAVVALFALVHFNNPARVNSLQNPGTQQFGIIPVSTADDAWNAYLTKGRETGSVIAEVPTRVLIESRPAPSGDGYELLYLRQVIERTTVPDLYQYTGQDESGRPTPVRYRPEAGGAM